MIIVYVACVCSSTGIRQLYYVVAIAQAQYTAFPFFRVSYGSATRMSRSGVFGRSRGMSDASSCISAYHVPTPAHSLTTLEIFLADLSRSCSNAVNVYCLLHSLLSLSPCII